MTPQVHVERSKADLETLRKTEFVPTKPVTLHEAMARAVAFNLKRRVSQIERNIAEAELEQSNYNMLPALELNANRNINDVEVSPSDDRITKSANATFTWNLLDLGVSYARAKQRADEVLIAKEKERKALQDIIRDVNTAYWRAATGQRLMTRVRALAKDLQLAMKASRRMEETRATDVITAVAFRREVVESVRQAISMQRELQEAKSELAELLNIRPGTDFELAVPEKMPMALGLPMSIEQMERHALLNRPELRIEGYNERVSEWEAREALYGMLPGLDLSVARNYSSETSNLNPNWISTGLHLGMNLFNLFSGSSQVETAERKGDLARQQRLALSLAALTQLHIALVKYRHSEQQMRLVKEIADSDRRLARLVGTNGQFLNKDYFEAVRLATRQLSSEMDERRTYIELVSSHADVMHAIGYDVFPEKIPLNDIASLTEAIRKMTEKWEIAGSDADPVAKLPMNQLVSGLLPAAKPAPTAMADATPDRVTRSPPRDDASAPANEEMAQATAPDGPAATEPQEAEVAAALPADEPQDDAAPETGNPESSTSVVARPPESSDIADADDGPGDTLAETAKQDEPVLPAVAEIVEQLNKIAPASRGGARVYATPTRDWELAPEATYRPPMEPLLGHTEDGASSVPARYIVSLGAFRQQDNAFKLHKELAAKAQDLFGDAGVDVVLRPSTSGTTYYFVQTGPIADRGTARKLCRNLKRSGRSCRVSVDLARN